VEAPRNSAEAPCDSAEAPCDSVEAPQKSIVAPETEILFIMADLFPEKFGIVRLFSYICNENYQK